MAKKAAVRASLLALVAALAAAPGAPAAVTVTAAGDAWTTSQFPTRNLGREAVMRVNSKPVKRAFVRFDVTTPGVTRAVLRVFAQTAGPRGFQVNAISAAWTETTITHATAPTPGALVATVPAFTTTNSWREIDVTSAVTGVGPVAFVITIPSATADLTFTSKEGGRNPELVLETGTPPVSVSPPAITGTAAVGQTLTAVAGAWTGTAPISYAYQWQRCDASGGACVDITGSIGTGYLVGAADAGRTIRVRETASNSGGSASATSSATAVVPTPVVPPTAVAPPTLTGTPHLGQTLTAVPGTWTGTPPLAFTLQWLRCDATGAACTDVAGQTGTTYVLGTDDLGHTVRVRETASNAAGPVSATSAAAGSVIDPGTAPSPVSPPTITGTAEVGQTLTAVAGTWTGTAPIAFFLQWQRCDAGGGACVDVPGEAGTTYLLDSDDIGHTIRVRETGANLAGSASATSSATAVVPTPVEAPAAITPPTLTGTPRVGQALTVVPGAWTGTPPLALGFEWLRCDASGGSCVEVDGETGTTYLLGLPDLGSTIRVRATATNDHGTASATSEASGVVVDDADDPPASSTQPAITGTAEVGQTLTAVAGAWTGTEPIAFAYQWQRCDGSGAACADVAGEAGTTYLLETDDLGSTIRVRETASNTAGTASATSAATGQVSDVPPPSSCSRADATGCAAVAGSRISLLNQKFSCARPLAEIAAQNPIGGGPGRLPLLIEVDFTTYLELSPAVVDLRNDCAGDGDDSTIDLILDIDGDGRTRGGMVDAIKVRLTAHDIQITGQANCGPRGMGPDGLDGTRDDLHQDGAQLQGGDTIEFIDFEWGDWETSTATCQGAAGTFATGQVNATAPVINMACIRCKSVSCNHGMAIGAGSQFIRVEDSMWRTSNPADMTVPLATGATGICRFGSPACMVDTTSHNGFPPPTNVTLLRNTCDTWPYGV
jgi:uncharacterized protein YukE